MLQTVWDRIARLDDATSFSSLVSDRRNRVVMYHSVGDAGLFGNVSPARLRADVEHLRAAYEIADLPEVFDDKSGSRVALTFDDAYENFYTDAYPILQEYDVPATVYVVSGAIDESAPESSIDPADTMNADQLAELAADDLVTIGNHTRTHPRLGDINDDDRLRDEIFGAKTALERRFGITVDRFCYPHGSLNDRTTRLVRDSHDSSLAVGLRQWWFEPGTRHEVTRVRGHDPLHQFRWKLTDLSVLLMRGARETGLVSGGIVG